MKSPRPPLAPQPSLCAHDTNGDGDCAFCSPMARAWCHADNVHPTPLAHHDTPPMATTALARRVLYSLCELFPQTGKMSRWDPPSHALYVPDRWVEIIGPKLKAMYPGIGVLPLSSLPATGSPKEGDPKRGPKITPRGLPVKGVPEGGPKKAQHVSTHTDKPTSPEIGGRGDGTQNPVRVSGWGGQRGGSGRPETGRKPHTVRLCPQLWTKVENRATELHTSVSDVITDALLAHLA